MSNTEVEKVICKICGVGVFHDHEWLHDDFQKKRDHQAEPQHIYREKVSDKPAPPTEAKQLAAALAKLTTQAETIAHLKKVNTEVNRRWAEAEARIERAKDRLFHFLGNGVNMSSKLSGADQAQIEMRQVIAILNETNETEKGSCDV